TLALLPLFVAGFWKTRGLRRVATITTVGMTTVFVPQDLEFMNVSAAELRQMNAHLVPLIAHDRAGFGGALASCGVAMFLSVLYGKRSRSLRQALAIAGAVGFATAIGIHPLIGYTSLSHLGPAVAGAPFFSAGMVLSYRRASPAVEASLGPDVAESVRVERARTGGIT
ncbi:MAG: hypothetical protein ACXW29_07625, partial [Thermoanaerobaculia bacterium]